MVQDKNSADSLIDATRERTRFSGHGSALGAAGERQASFDPENSTYLHDPGQSISVSPGDNGFDHILIGVEWDNVAIKKKGFFGKLLGKLQHKGVDLDLGCLYELADGTRGALQAFGNKYGALHEPPYIKLSGDDRTGDAEGADEVLEIKGEHWDKIKRVLVYIYIYKGASRWDEINPKIFLDIPGEDDLVVTLNSHDDALDLCAVGGLENVRGGIKLTNYTEYFPGHPSMDRAFGFGIDWSDGQKT